MSVLIACLQIKFNRFDMATRKWMVRDVPLNEEEMACWSEQAQWLICPVTYVPASAP